VSTVKKVVLLLFLLVSVLLVAWTFWYLRGPGSRIEPVHRADDKSHLEVALDRQRYEEWFATPYSQIHNLKGGCVAWVDMGHCIYHFYSQATVQVRNRKSFTPFPCEEGMSQLSADNFDENVLFRNLEELVCVEGKTQKGADLRIIRNKYSNVYFVSESYDLRGLTSR
jgi:hypothetical protein